MRTVFARESLPQIPVGSICPNSIFLVGPTPRDPRYVLSWRPRALNILENLGFNGTVFVPEKDTWGLDPHPTPALKKTQVAWEHAALAMAACVACWVPRDIGSVPETGRLKMPAFTTNVEFGLLIGLAPERVVLGIPLDADKIDYLRYVASHAADLHAAFGKTPPPLPFPGVPITHTLEETLSKAIILAGE